MPVDEERLRDLTLELVEVPSPTGDTAEVARLYARRLEEIGMEVELLDDVFPATPTVIGRLRGSEPGPTIVLNGHLDTVPIPHEPPRLEDGAVYGRGSADMKGACAAAAEAVRVFAEQPFRGEVVVVAIGLHEAPGGRGEDLRHLLESGFTADMAVVCELSGERQVAVAHMGQATAEITVSRPGMPTHELKTPAGTPHPLLAAAKVVDAIARRSEELAADEHPWVGAETYFVGELHGGDFYNRFPTTCRIVGTRRWMPGNTLAAVEAEYRELLARVAEETGCEIELDLKLVRGAYEIDESHPLLHALEAAYLEVTGRELERAGMKTVADGALLAAAGIPTVYHGPVGSGAHADVEFMPVAELVRAAEVYVALLRRLLS
ncbi:MAG TPA: M20/M25/M40 family metallo-hydrolase [Gaiellaceae bacterium]|nr:M20/M25/M40 family metallo-hydrolase [Gaiellaceae bacterium]